MTLVLFDWHGKHGGLLRLSLQHSAVHGFLQDGFLGHQLNIQHLQVDHQPLGRVPEHQLFLGAVGFGPPLMPGRRASSPDQEKEGRSCQELFPACPSPVPGKSFVVFPGLSGQAVSEIFMNQSVISISAYSKKIQGS